MYQPGWITADCLFFAWCHVLVNVSDALVFSALFLGSDNAGHINVTPLQGSRLVQRSSNKLATGGLVRQAHLIARERELHVQFITI